MNVTINDIARATGLSTATISKYINHKKIREENRTLIEKGNSGAWIYPKPECPASPCQKHTYHRYPDLRSW
mgnify:CR=1 FL=1